MSNISDGQFNEFKEANRREHDGINDHLDSLSVEVSGLSKHITNHLSHLPQQFASKQVERDIRKMVWLIISTVVMALVTLIFK